MKSLPSYIRGTLKRYTFCFHFGWGLPVQVIKRILESNCNWKMTIEALGYRKFNNSLLEDEIYVKLITDSYAVIQNKYSEIEDKRLKWELIKMEIRGITIPFSKNKAKQLHQKERDIQNRLQVLDRVISNSPNTDCIRNEINEYNNLKEEIDLIYQKKGKGNIIRYKCK